MRQRRPVHPDHAEEIHVKEALGVGGIGKLDGAGDAEAGAIDHQIQPPMAAGDVIDRRRHRRLIGEIHGPVVKPFRAGPPAAQGMDRVSGPIQRNRRRQSNARGSAGHNRNLLHLGTLLYFYNRYRFAPTTGEYPGGNRTPVPGGHKARPYGKTGGGSVGADFISARAAPPVFQGAGFWLVGRGAGPHRHDRPGANISIPSSARRRKSRSEV